MKNSAEVLNTQTTDGFVDLTLREHFHIDGTSRELFTSFGDKELLASMERKRSAWLLVCAHVEANAICGTVLRRGNDDAWSIITPDVEPGFYRYTCFDRRGFYAHGQYHKAEGALTAAFSMGFRSVVSSDVLSAVSSCPEWTVQ